MDLKRIAYRFFKGVIRAVAGAMVAGVCCLSGMAFFRVSRDVGYLAVVDFVGAIAMMVVSIAGVYYLGGGSKKQD